MAKSAIVIGAGIAGLAMARALAVRGYKVKVIERNHKAVGASIRNFGMIWPIGQPGEKLYQAAMLSRSIWKQLCNEAGIWYDETGSLHVAYAEDEWQVMEEFAEASKTYRACKMLTATQTTALSGAVVSKGLRGSLWSPDEMIVDPRIAIAALPVLLTEKYGVEFIWGKAVTEIYYSTVYMGSDSLEADQIVVCSGADFETLFPEVYVTAGITKCKLQMMRLAAQPNNWRIGPSLCGALSLIHYKGFAAASSLSQLKKRFEQEHAEYLEWGIHVMVSQNQAGELTVGDSHEYGDTHDPFDKHHINQLILNYFKKFAAVKDESVIETWNGIYPKLVNGESHIVLQPEEGVTIINALGGAGMTLSFGLCEQLVADGHN
ncbi:MAG TPA: TIGR03364 family FAD-dependent oxidoreductase [Chitinophagaceae bacterium]